MQEEGNIQFVSANDLRIGSHIIMNDGACIILDISKSKTGKHGSAKAHITARNIFNDKKIEGLYSTSEMVKVPIVKKESYIVSNIVDDNELVLLNENSEEIIGFATLDESEVSKKIKTMFDDGKVVVVNVISALGMARVFDCSEDKETK